MSLFGAIVFYVLAFVFLMLALNGLSFSIYQSKVNKKAFGKVALAISLVCLIGIIAGTIALCVVLI